MGKVKQMEIKNRTFYFYNDLTISNISNQTCKKSIKIITKALIFTKLDTLQLKKWRL